MIFLILMIVLGICFSMFLYKMSKGILSFSIVISFIITAFLTGFVFFVLFCYSYKYGKVSETKYEIVSLNNRIKTQGSFVLGCGQIRSTEYYFVMRKKYSNCYTRVSIMVRGTDIIEQKNCSPHVVKVYKNFDNWFITTAKFFIKNKIYVPENTVIQNFEIK